MTSSIHLSLLFLGLAVTTPTFSQVPGANPGDGASIQAALDAHPGLPIAIRLFNLSG